MTCDQARLDWHDRLDGELAAADDARLAAHLSSCANCRAWAAQTQGVVDGLGELRRQTEAIAAEYESAASAAAPTSAPEPVAPRIIRARLTAQRVRTIARIAAAVVLLLGGSLAYRLMRDQAGIPSRHGLRGGGGGTNVAVLPNDATAAPAGGGPLRPRVALAGNSAAAFMTVEQKTSQPAVHVFRLLRVYQQPAAAASAPADAST